VPIYPELNWEVMDNKDNRKESMEGIVTARTCDCCGHHEIGIMTQDGKYVQLKPGMKIKITEEK
jgi:dihydrodipicolinate reductase